MVSTRQSSRIAAQNSSPTSQNNSSPKSATGTKRKSDTASSSKPKRGKKGAVKEQKPIEKTIPKDEAKSKLVAKDQPTAENGATEVTDNGAKEGRGGAHAENVDELAKPGAPGLRHDESAVEAGAREEEAPSSILEKGIIYFFFRARVNVHEPHDTDDIARSYLVLRPIPHGAKIGDGPIGDSGNCRLLALPKKVLPRSGRDRFMAFVEKAKVSFKELKDDFISASDHTTKTKGTSHTPAATPIGEGVYAITTTGRESHLAYILTIPSDLGEVQIDMGLRKRGSFVTSIKNPEQPGPANARLPRPPDYPKEIIDEFRGLRFMSLQPKHLDYPNAQLLLIGHSHGLDHATEALDRDQRHDKETPLEEMEKLEGEDEIRVKHLSGDDAVFADLGLTSKEYPKVQTTWEIK